MGWGFDSLFDFYGDNMHMWTIDYVNLNHNVYVSISKARVELLEIEKEAFEIKLKQDIIVPPMRDYNFYWVKK